MTSERYPLLFLLVLVWVPSLSDGYVNVARGKPVKVKDTFNMTKNKPANAVDGFANLSTAGCTHSNSLTNTWLVVDFLRDYLVHEVNITNRPEAFLPERLQKFTVQISQESPLTYPGFPFTLPGKRCFFRDAYISGKVPEMIPCASPIIGRYLTVFKAANGILAICELEALATNVSQQFQFQAVRNKRKQADPFSTHSRARSGLECVSLCSRPLNGTATVVQYRGSDGLCECLQVSSLDDPQPLEVDSPGSVMYVSKFN